MGKVRVLKTVGYLPVEATSHFVRWVVRWVVLFMAAMSCLPPIGATGTDSGTWAFLLNATNMMERRMRLDGHATFVDMPALSAATDTAALWTASSLLSARSAAQARWGSTNTTLVIPWFVGTLFARPNATNATPLVDWMPMCADVAHFANTEAAVACRSLGFRGGRRLMRVPGESITSSRWNGSFVSWAGRCVSAGVDWPSLAHCPYDHQLSASALRVDERTNCSSIVRLLCHSLPGIAPSASRMQSDQPSLMPPLANLSIVASDSVVGNGAVALLDEDLCPRPSSCAGWRVVTRGRGAVRSFQVPLRMHAVTSTTRQDAGAVFQIAARGGTFFSNDSSIRMWVAPLKTPQGTLRNSTQVRLDRGVADDEGLATVCPLGTDWQFASSASMRPSTITCPVVVRSEDWVPVGLCPDGCTAVLPFVIAHSPAASNTELLEVVVTFTATSDGASYWDPAPATVVGWYVVADSDSANILDEWVHLGLVLNTSANGTALFGHFGSVWLLIFNNTGSVISDSPLLADSERTRLQNATLLEPLRLRAAQRGTALHLAPTRGVDHVLCISHGDHNGFRVTLLPNVTTPPWMAQDLPESMRVLLKSRSFECGAIGQEPSQLPRAQDALVECQETPECVGVLTKWEVDVEVVLCRIVDRRLMTPFEREGEGVGMGFTAGMSALRYTLTPGRILLHWKPYALEDASSGCRVVLDASNHTVVASVEVLVSQDPCHATTVDILGDGLLVARCTVGASNGSTSPPDQCSTFLLCASVPMFPGSVLDIRMASLNESRCPYVDAASNTTTFCGPLAGTRRVLVRAESYASADNSTSTNGDHNYYYSPISQPPSLTNTSVFALPSGFTVITRLVKLPLHSPASTLRATLLTSGVSFLHVAVAQGAPFEERGVTVALGVDASVDDDVSATQLQQQHTCGGPLYAYNNRTMAPAWDQCRTTAYVCGSSWLPTSSSLISLVVKQADIDAPDTIRSAQQQGDCSSTQTFLVYAAVQTSSMLIDPTAGFSSEEFFGVFRVLLAVPATEDTSLHFRAGAPRPSRMTLVATSVLIAPDNNLLYMMNWAQPGSFPAPQLSLSSRARLGCVMDVVSFPEGGRCLFPVPTESAGVRIKVNNANLWKPSQVLTVTAVFNDTSSGRQHVATIGGGQVFGDGTEPSPTELACLTFPVAVVHALSSSAPPAYIEVHASFDVMYDVRCKIAAIVLLEYFGEPTSPNVDDLQGGLRVPCASGNVTIPVTGICNGVAECIDGEDEAFCAEWYPVDEGATVNFTAARDVLSADNITRELSAVTSTQSGWLSCRRACISYTLSYFVHNASTGNPQDVLVESCKIFQYDPVSRVCAFPDLPSLGRAYVLGAVSPFRVEAPASTILTYARLPADVGGPVAFRHCSNRFSCSGNGVVSEATWGDGGNPAAAHCVCVCNVGFTGSACRSPLPLLRGLDSILVGFPATATFVASTLRATGQVLSGLSGQPVTYTCGALARDRSVVYTLCSVASGEANAWIPYVSNKQELLQIMSLVVTPAPTEIRVAPFPASQSSLRYCSAALSSTNVSCMSPVPREAHIPAFILLATSLLSSLAMNITFLLEPTSLQRRSGTTERVFVSSTCTPGGQYDNYSWVSSVTDGIFAISCGFDMNRILSGGAFALVNLSVVVFNVADGNRPLTAAELVTPMAISWGVTTPLPAAVTVSEVHNLLKDFSVLYISAAVLGGLGALCAVVCATFLHRYITLVRASEPRGRESGVKDDQAIGVAGIAQAGDLDTFGGATAHHQDTIEYFVVDEIHREDLFARTNAAAAQRFVLATGIATGLCWVGGILLALVFMTSSLQLSNTTLLLEVYTDSSCAQSQFTPYPFAVVAIEPETSRKCVRRAVVGELPSNGFTRGFCENGPSGMPIVHIVITASEAACAASPWVTVPAGACLQQESRYIRFTCGDTSSAVQRIKAASVAMSGTAISDQVTQVEQSPDEWLLSMGAFLNTNSMVHAYPVLRLGSLTMRTSFTAGVLEAYTSWESLPEPRSPHSLVLQRSDETFASPVNTEGSRTSQVFMNASSSWVATQEILIALFPTGPELAVAAVSSFLSPFEWVHPEQHLPFGSIFNAFGTQQERSQSSARVDAVRYHGGSGVVFDLGSSFDSIRGADGEDVHVSLYVRASPTSLGFAFAIADGWLDTASGGSPIIERALEMIASSDFSDASWFASTYRLYGALYVDGPGRVLRWMHAAPSNADVDTAGSVGKGGVEILSWDLESLGLARLLNGHWHHVVIAFRRENGLSVVQLVVDGETSRYKSGWSQCMKAPLASLQEMPAGSSVPVPDASSNVVLDTSILWVGYFNGGVAQLTFKHSPLSVYDVWRFTTAAIRAHNPLDRSSYYLLGTVLAVCAASALLVTVEGVWRSWYRQSLSQRMRRSAKSFVAYMNIAYADGAASVQQHDATMDQDGLALLKVMRPLRFATALRWLNLTPLSFHALLKEIHETSETQHAAKRDLFRLLWATKRREMMRVGQQVAFGPIDEGDSFSVSAWDALLQFCEEEMQTDDPDPFSWDYLHGVVDSTRREARWVSPRSAPVASHSRPSALMIAVQDVLDKLQRRPQKRSDDFQHEQVDKRHEEKLDISDSDDDQVDEEEAEANDLEDRSGDADGGLSDVLLISLATIGVLQIVQAWMTSMSLPLGYLDVFRSAFSAIALDWSVFLPMDGLILPMLQFFLSVTFFFALIFIVGSDVRAFNVYTARYVLHHAVATSKPNNRKTASPVGESDTSVASLQKLLAHTRASMDLRFQARNAGCATPLLPLGVCQQIDRWLEISEGDLSAGLSAPAGSVSGEFVSNELTITLESGHNLVLQRMASFRSMSAAERIATTKIINHLDWGIDETASCTSSSRLSGGDEANMHFGSPSALRCCGPRCPMHKGILIPVAQTKIWPFMGARQCCIVTSGGEPCASTTGTMFVCTHKRHDSGCAYAVCASHHRTTSVKEQLLADALGNAEQIKSRGVFWVISVMLLAAADAIYTPALRSAMMIMACHPRYQCEFDSCTVGEDQRYTIAYFLSLLVVVFFGAGYPVILFGLLRSRGRMLHRIFDDAHVVPKGTPDHPRLAIPRGQWNTFAASDPSVLASLYQPLELRWIFLSPVLLAFKVLLLAPVVFLDPSTLSQNVGIAVVELVYALFMFLTAPFSSAAMNFMYRLGSIHQLSFLTVLNMDVVSRYDGGEEANYALGFIAITGTYLFVSGVVVLSLGIGSTLVQAWERRSIRNALAAIGRESISSTTLYINPHGGVPEGNWAGGPVTAHSASVDGRVEPVCTPDIPL